LKIDLPDGSLPSHAIAWFDYRNGYYYSVMHKAVRAAITALGWVDEAHRQFGEFWQGEARLADAGAYWEGREREHRLVSRARNGRAREHCIAYYGSRCVVCAFDFETVYGEHGRDFIEVHHLEPVANQQGTYEIDPIEDLRPVCSNCHRMLHRNGLMSIEELKEIIEPRRNRAASCERESP
jgi:predicted HNH restriction endonuclease